MGTIYDEKIRVTYYDLDCRGKLKLTALLRMAHIAADVNANHLGVGFNDLSPLGISFVLQRFGLEVTRLPAYDETVRIRTWPAQIARGTFTRRGDLYDTHGNKLMDWCSLWVLFDLNERKILRPSALPVTLPELGKFETTAETTRINYPDGWGEAFSAYRHTVHYSEVDTNRHMNNTVYGDLIGNVLYMHGSNDSAGDMKRVQINYLAETRLGETIDIACRHSENDFWITGSEEGRPVFAATVACGA